MGYFAHIAERGPIRWGTLPGSIGVIEAPDRFMPIGIAQTFRWNEARLAVWRLNVHGRDVPGEWVIIDGEFRPLIQEGQAPQHG